MVYYKMSKSSGVDDTNSWSSFKMLVDDYVNKKKLKSSPTAILTIWEPELIGIELIFLLILTWRIEKLLNCDGKHWVCDSTRTVRRNKEKGTGDTMNFTRMVYELDAMRGM